MLNTKNIRKRTLSPRKEQVFGYGLAKQCYYTKLRGSIKEGQAQGPPSFLVNTPTKLQERIPRITIHEAEPRQPRPKQRKPATTFDEIIGLAPLDEPDRDRRPSSLSRAATALRKRIIGRTQEEKDAKLEKNRTKELTNLFSELTLERAAERRTTRLRNLREKAIGGNSLGWYSLEELAESELVYINPRRTRQRGFQGDERALADGLVARLSGLLQDSYYIFLGYDKNLYISTYKTGRAATVIPLKTERQQYSEYRELSRAYYQLCAKLDLDE